MKRFFAFTLFTVCLARFAAAQTTPKIVTLPALTIDNTTIDSIVTYDAARRVYRYEYRINAPTTNKAPVGSIAIDVQGRTPRPQIDPDLTNNISRRETRDKLPLTPQPLTSLPVGFIIPDPLGTVAGLTPDAYAYIGGFAWDVAPGASLGGFILESKFPPGPRTIRLTPSQDAWDVIEEQYRDSEGGVEYHGEGERINYEVKLAGVGPSELTEADLYSGGGQQPAEVNKFLRFAAPLDNRIKVRAGTAAYNVIVYYGNTILPATFSATLNGTDISLQFHPTQGGAEAIRIPIGPGTTKLQISVTGVKGSGGRGTDSDTLTFLPQ